MSSAAQKRKLKRTIRSYFAYFEEEYVPESLSKTKLMEWLTPEMRNDFDDFDPLVHSRRLSRIFLRPELFQYKAFRSTQSQYRSIQKRVRSQGVDLDELATAD